MDHAATTAVRPEVLEAMLPFFGERFGNPSNVYSLALDARRALDEARETVARCLGMACAGEVIFTSGGTEADNLALVGLARAHRRQGNHIITTQIEHHAVLHTCQALEREGFQVTYLPVDEQGRVSPEAVEAALRPHTILVSVMAANNEVGTLQPLAEIARRLSGRGVLLHTDAVQAAGSVPLDAQATGFDALSLSAHKLYGPKGAGALLLRSGVRLEPLLHGGGQEKGRRSGTENVPGAVGLATALRLACAEMPTAVPRLQALRDRLIGGVLASIEGVRLTGHPQERLPGLASFVFEAAEGESILLQLDRKGVCASTGSACSTATLEPSHVLRAMRLPLALARGSLRLSLGRGNTEEEVDYVLEVLPGIVSRLRSVAPRGLARR
jgi:cysteine desulfurase